MSVNFTIGVDPEIFVRLNGKPVSAHGLVKGTKESPHPVERGAIQVDGMALEFNTEPVSLFGFAAFSKFNENITTVISKLREELKKENNEKYSLSLVPVQEFSQEEFDKAPDEAKELGCDPDYNAYTGKLNDPPKGDEVLFRTASGHGHIGWGADIPADHPDHIEICRDFVKILDVTVGMFMTIIDREPRRRELYGKAGAFRPKSYGVEYRTPSNVWLKNEERKRLFFSYVQTAVTCHSRGYTFDNFKTTEEEVQKVINEGDFERAFEILNSPTLRANSSREYRKILKRLFLQRCKEEDRQDLIEKYSKDKNTYAEVEKRPTAYFKVLAGLAD